MSIDMRALELALREVKALSAQPNPEMVSWSRVRSALLEAADELRSQAGQARAPIDVAQIASLRNIKQEPFASQSSPTAVLVPIRQGFLLRLSSGSHVRTRFSIAHEIGHTFFYDLASSPPTRLIARNPTGKPWRKEEDICNAFASELLMPRELVENETRNFKGNRKLGLCQRLADHFAVSLEVAIIRMLKELQKLPNSFVIVRECLIKSDKAEPVLFRSQRHWAKGLTRSSLRKRERHFLTEIERALDEQSPFNAVRELRKLARDRTDGTTIEWKVRSSPNRWRLLILVGLRNTSEPHPLPYDRDDGDRLESHLARKST